MDIRRYVEVLEKSTHAPSGEWIRQYFHEHLQREQSLISMWHAAQDAEQVSHKHVQSGIGLDRFVDATVPS